MLQLIKEEDIQNEKLEHIEKLENDIEMINETMNLLNKIYLENNISKKILIEDLKSIDADILQANKQTLMSINERQNYIKNTFALSGLAIMCINVPIGIVFGIPIFIASSTLTIAGVTYLF